MRHAFIACCLSALVTVLCVFAGPVLMLTYAVEGAVKGAKEAAFAWWAFVRLPWLV